MKNPRSIQKLKQYSQGLTGDRLRLYFDSFRRINFAIPPKNEQVTIANAIESVDHRLQSKERQLASVNKIKKALMQDLLTGKVRVSVE